MPPPLPAGTSLFEDQLRAALRERVGKPYQIDAVSDPRDIRIQIQLPDGVLAADVPRKIWRANQVILVVRAAGEEGEQENREEEAHRRRRMSC